MVEKVKLKKSGITAFVHVKNKTEKYVDVAVTFSEPVMESALKSSAKKVLVKGYKTIDSYIRVEFDFEQLPEEQACAKFKEFLNQLDDEFAKVKRWTTLKKALKIETGVE